jgi:hypothetical protein
MSLPSKLTSYMAAGRPIIGAVRPDGATAREIAFSGSGIVVDGEGVNDLLRTIDQLTVNPDSAGRLGANGQAYAASDLSPETSLAKIADLVTSH